MHDDKNGPSKISDKSVWWWLFVQLWRKVPFGLSTDCSEHMISLFRVLFSLCYHTAGCQPCQRWWWLNTGSTVQNNTRQVSLKVAFVSAYLLNQCIYLEHLVLQGSPEVKSPYTLTNGNIDMAPIIEPSCTTAPHQTRALWPSSRRIMPMITFT